MSAITKEAMEMVWFKPKMITLSEALEKINQGSVVANQVFLNEYFFKKDGKLFMEYSDRSKIVEIKELPTKWLSEDEWIEIKRKTTNKSY